MSPIGTIFELGAAPVLEEALSFAERRHRLILSNVANADTPGYRRQDLDEGRFRAALARAIRERGRDHPHRFDLPGRERVHRPVTTHGGVLHGDRVAFQPGRGPLRHDENDVSMEREMAILAQNAGLFSTFSTLLRKEWSQLRAAITERPGEG